MVPAVLLFDLNLMIQELLNSHFVDCQHYSSSKFLSSDWCPKFPQLCPVFNCCYGFSSLWLYHRRKGLALQFLSQKEASFGECQAIQ